MRWFWLDRFTEFVSGSHATAVKCVSLSEDHLHDHWPYYPVMPNTLVAEGMAQCGGLLVSEVYQFRELVVLAKFAKCVFEGEARPGDVIQVAHAPVLESMSQVRRKIYGHRLDARALAAIVGDVAAGRYPDTHIAAFISACAGGRMDAQETIDLTGAMVAVGERLSWPGAMVADKHCVGGLPGNRTTPIIVAIAAAAGLVIPKTSSRAITSPAGTADVMETLTNVALDVNTMRRVVEREGACLVWGGALSLSPADEALIRVERPLDIDSDAQLVASVLSKKIAAGSTHIVIDLPVGPTAKVRGAKADFIRLDVTDPGSVESFRDGALKKSGNVDILASVAGWGKTEPFVKNTPEFWKKLIDLNLVGTIMITRAFLDPMMERNSGKIVTVASDAGRVGSLGETVYSGAKGGVIAFSKGLAREMARYNITVNCVCPGPTDTPLMAAVPDKIKDAFARVTPMRRLAKPAEVADAILFFAGPQSQFVTGQVLSVSGGLTMAG